MRGGGVWALGPGPGGVRGALRLAENCRGCQQPRACLLQWGIQGAHCNAATLNTRAGGPGGVHPRQQHRGRQNGMYVQVREQNRQRATRGCLVRPRNSVCISPGACALLLVPSNLSAAQQLLDARAAYGASSAAAAIGGNTASCSRRRHCLNIVTATKQQRRAATGVTAGVTGRPFPCRAPPPRAPPAAPWL